MLFPDIWTFTLAFRDGKWSSLSAVLYDLVLLDDPPQIFQSSAFFHHAPIFNVFTSFRSLIAPDSSTLNTYTIEAWVISGFLTFFTGWGCQPHDKPPAWRIRPLYYIPQKQGGPVEPPGTRYSFWSPLTTQVVCVGAIIISLPPHGKVGNQIRDFPITQKSSFTILSFTHYLPINGH